MSGIRRDQSPDRRQGADRRLGQEIRPGENQPAGQLDQERRLEADHRSKTFRTTRCTIRAIRALAAGLARGPCMFGEDERAGRWSGMEKTECGLHTVDEQDGSGI